jgi:hypothetical protein
MLLIVPVAAALLLGGCLINSSSKTEYSGRYLSPAAVSQIEPGETRQDFVLATIGEPTTKTALDDGSEIWKWEYRKTRSSSGSVFLLLNSDNQTRSEGATYVVFRDGVVEKVWQE